MSVLASLNLRTDPIPYLLRRITVPTSVGLIFSTLLTATDTFYASWYSVEAAAAVALTAPFMFFLITFGVGIGRATIAMVGKSLGVDDIAKARRQALQALSLAAVASILTAICVAIFLPQVFGGIDSGPLSDLAARYAHLILFFAPLFSLPIVANAILITRGLPMAYRNAQIAAFVVNILLDPLFMYGFEMGVQGIALASVVTQLGAFVYMAIHLVRLDFISAPNLREFLPHPGTFVQLAKQGIPTSTSMLILALSNVLIIWFVGDYGSEVLAGYGIALRIEQICLLPLVGLMQAVSSLTSVNHGAADSARVGLTLHHGYRLALALSMLMLVMLLAGSATIMRIFSDTEGVRIVGAGYLNILALTLPGYAVVYVTAAAMQGLGRPTLALAYNLLRSVLLTVTIAIIALYVIGTGIEGIWWAICLANWSSAAIMWAHLRRSPDVLAANHVAGQGA